MFVCNEYASGGRDTLRMLIWDISLAIVASLPVLSCSTTIQNIYWLARGSKGGVTVLQLQPATVRVMFKLKVMIRAVCLGT